MKISGGAKIKGGPKINPGAYPRIMTAGYSTFVPGVQQLLNNPITINGLSPLPLGIWLGVDGGGATWTSRQPTPGVALTLTGAASDPVLDSSTPFFGDPLSSALRFPNATAKTYVGSNSFADPGTQDIVVEMVLAPVTGGGFPINKRDGGGGGVGWRVYTNTSSQAQLQLSGASGDRNIVGTLTGWAHLLIFADRSGSGIIYTNGSPGAALDISALVADNISIVRAFSLGGKYVQTDAAVTGILYVAIYMAQSWLDTHLQPTLASQRAQLLFNTRPQYWWGPFISPTAAGSTSQTAQVHQIDASTNLVCQIGASNIARFQRVIARDGRVLTGVLVEGAVQNLIRQSNQFNTTWGKRGTCAVTENTTETLSPANIYNANKVTGLNTGANDLSIGVSGLNPGDPLINGLWIKRISTSGQFQMKHFNAGANGLWYVDLANLPDAWVHITKWSPYVTITTPFTVRADGSAGLLFSRNDAGVDISVYLYNAQQRVNSDDPGADVFTTTTAVTKAADNYYYTLAASSLSDTEGTLLLRFIAPQNFVPIVNKFLATLSVGALTTNTVSIFIDTNGRVNVTTTSTGGGSDAGSVVESSGTRCDGYIHEVKVTWVHNSLKLYVDNVLIGEDTVIDPPVGLNRLRIGNDAADTAGLQAGPIVVADVQAFASATNIRRVGF